MERSQLLYAVTIAECGTFTAAAEKLHLSQPSLSSQILLLEEEIGIPVFERTRKGVVVTEAGALFLKEAEDVLQKFDLIANDMQNYSNLTHGNLRIGALSTMTAFGIPALLKSFMHQHPQITLSLREGGSASLLELLKEGKLDAVFTIMPADFKDEEHVQFLPLATSSVLCGMSRTNPLSKKKEIHYEDLENQQLIVTNQNFNFNKVIMHALEQAGVNVKPSFVCSQVESTMVLADMGFGIVFGTEATASYYDHVSLVFRPLVPEITRTMSLAYRGDPKYHPLLNEFLKFVTNYSAFDLKS